MKCFGFFGGNPVCFVLAKLASYLYPSAFLWIMWAMGALPKGVRTEYVLRLMGDALIWTIQLYYAKAVNEALDRAMEMLE